MIQQTMHLITPVTVHIHISSTTKGSKVKLVYNVTQFCYGEVVVH